MTEYAYSNIKNSEMDYHIKGLGGLKRWLNSSDSQDNNYCCDKTTRYAVCELAKQKIM